MALQGSETLPGPRELAMDNDLKKDTDLTHTHEPLQVGKTTVIGEDKVTFNIYFSMQREALGYRLVSAEVRIYHNPS